MKIGQNIFDGIQNRSSSPRFYWFCFTHSRGLSSVFMSGRLTMHRQYLCFNHIIMKLWSDIDCFFPFRIGSLSNEIVRKARGHELCCLRSGHVERCKGTRNEALNEIIIMAHGWKTHQLNGVRDRHSAVSLFGSSRANELVFQLHKLSVIYKTKSKENTRRIHRAQSNAGMDGHVRWFI